jgi:hypothetical protein
MPSILLPFDRFPKEAAIIGRLLAGYSTLELDLMHCVSMVRDDLDAALKTMFRARGETQRISIADALGRNYYRDHKLGTDFEMVISAMRYALKIRNQYSHCIWYDDNTGHLAFVNLEEVAEANDRVTDLGDLTVSHVDLPLLKAQEAYFIFVDRGLAWANHEGRRRAGTLSNHTIVRPRQMKRPPLHIP